MKTFKSIILTFVLTASILFSSCSSDDDNTEDLPIVGTFLLTSIKTERFLDDVLIEEQEEFIDENGNIRNLLLNYTFSSDNIISIFSSPSENGNVENLSRVGTYTITGDVLVLAFGEEREEFSFILNGDILTLLFEKTEELNGDTTRFIQTFTLNRQ